MASRKQIKMMDMGLMGKKLVCRTPNCGHAKSDHKIRKTKTENTRTECTWDMCSCQQYKSPINESDLL